MTKHHHNRQSLFRTRLVILAVKAILLLTVLFARASLFVRSSSSDAFVLSPCSRFWNNNLQFGRKSTGRIVVNTIDGSSSWNRNAFSKSVGGTTITKTTTTATFVFSRLGETSTRTTRTTTPSDSSATIINSTRGYCPRCKRPNVVCICHALPEKPIDCGTRILILQHPREAKKRKRTSTVPLIGLSVKNVEICVGTTFEEGSHPLLDEALAMSDNNNGGNGNLGILLYPSEHAIPLQTYLETFATTTIASASSKDETTAEETRSSNILVVVDGTWAQTQTMVQNSKDTLRRLPSVMFDDQTNSLFDSLRQEPAEHCTSTLEAVARAIRLVGRASEERAAAVRAAIALEESLEAMVDGQLRFANDDEVAKPRYYRRNETTEVVVVSKRQKGRTRKPVSKKLQAGLSLPRTKTREELEFDRIRFVYIAHMG